MPHLILNATPLAPGRSPARIHYRSTGSGEPLVILHGNWGYDVYPYDAQIAALAEYRVIVPDRTGYGGSESIDVQLPGFQDRAAEETIAVIDALGIEPPILWGHSDGAIVALKAALLAPSRVRAVVAEATHFFCVKPASRFFFETMRDAPERLGDRVVAAMQREHGDRWRDLIATNGAAWLRIADEAPSPTADLYNGRLSELGVPLLVIHGGRDPRTEPGEFDALRAALERRTGPAADAPWERRIVLLPEAGHTPHLERASANQVTEQVRLFLERLPSAVRPSHARS